MVGEIRSLAPRLPIRYPVRQPSLGSRGKSLLFSGSVGGRPEVGAVPAPVKEQAIRHTRLFAKAGYGESAPFRGRTVRFAGGWRARVRAAEQVAARGRHG
jgi:hypothetical protein